MKVGEIVIGIEPSMPHYNCKGRITEPHITLEKEETVSWWILWEDGLPSWTEENNLRVVSKQLLFNWK